ncbi:MAG: ATP synthase F1 subunit epsilon [Ignavibacteria bacterium]|nr:ATP synthase F1 subunit epsilon [Ignavibacteria bacterium]
MTEGLIDLEIVTPGKVIFKGKVRSFTAPGSEGSFQILPRHAPFISTIIPGVVKLIPEEGNPRKFATAGGTVEVHSNKIIMLAEEIYPAEEININEAESEILEAEKILNSKEPGLDIAGIITKLKTAKAKLKAVNS